MDGGGGAMGRGEGRVRGHLNHHSGVAFFV